MIYTMGCSMTKWIWPTWSDWLQVYDQPVTNWGYKGYCNNQMYWQLLDQINILTPDDHVIIMWPQNHRLINWYDQEWINNNDCLGFFPKTNGKLWFTADTPYTGMYRTHPDHMTSLSHMIISGFDTILQTQLLLDKIGCKYTMTYSQNPWLDGRPTYSPTFATKWDSKNQISSEELKSVDRILSLRPVQHLLNTINWNAFVDAPTKLTDPTLYPGIWEYYIGKKELVMYKHTTDNHPNPLAHHDWTVEKLLKLDVKTSKYRPLAKQISISAMDMSIPSFTDDDYVAPVETTMLTEQFKNLLDNCK